MCYNLWLIHRYWWRHQMEAFSASLALCAENSPATGEFPIQRPGTRSFDIFFDLRLNIRLSKQSWGWWFVTPSRSLWRHCNVQANDLLNYLKRTKWQPTRTSLQKTQECKILQRQLYHICRMHPTLWRNPQIAFSWQIGPLLNAYNDDVIKWKHFPRYWPLVRGIRRSPVDSPHKGQWRGALMFSLICVWINGWVNNREAGDLRRYRAHYDVIVMKSLTRRYILLVHKHRCRSDYGITRNIQG